METTVKQQAYIDSLITGLGHEVKRTAGLGTESNYTAIAKMAIALNLPESMTASARIDALKTPLSYARQHLADMQPVNDRLIAALGGETLPLLPKSVQCLPALNGRPGCDLCTANGVFASTINGHHFGADYVRSLLA